MNPGVETREYAKVGKTTWRAEIMLDDGEDPRARYLASAEYPNRGLAKAWVNRTLPTFRPQVEGERPWVELRRGTYVDDSFDDGEFGHVGDASWEADERSQWYGQLAEDGITVDWQDDS
ncbi:MAG: hypothetical protein ACT4RN_09145 [Pseudonocardia sp.]